MAVMLCANVELTQTGGPSPRPGHGGRDRLLSQTSRKDTLPYHGSHATHGASWTQHLPPMAWIYQLTLKMFSKDINLSLIA